MLFDGGWHLDLTNHLQDIFNNQNTKIHTPKVDFYIVNFFLLFLNKSQKDPTFGFYNLADVTVFHSFKPKVEKIFMNSNE